MISDKIIDIETAIQIAKVSISLPKSNKHTTIQALDTALEMLKELEQELQEDFK
jgi:ribosomal protein L24